MDEIEQAYIEVWNSMDILELLIAVFRTFFATKLHSRRDGAWHSRHLVLRSRKPAIHVRPKSNAEPSIISSHLAVKFQHSRLSAF